MLPFALAAAHGVRHCSFSICTQAPGYDFAATVKLITCAAPRGDLIAAHSHVRAGSNTETSARAQNMPE